MSYLQSIWIHDDRDELLFQFHNQKTELTENFIDVVLKTLKTHYKPDNSKGITGFEIQNLYFFVYHEKNINFFGTTAKKENRFQALEELKEIASKFIHRYPMELLKSWSGDQQYFFDFYQQIVPPKTIPNSNAIEPLNKDGKLGKIDPKIPNPNLIHSEGNDH